MTTQYGPRGAILEGLEHTEARDYVDYLGQDTQWQREDMGD